MPLAKVRVVSIPAGAVALAGDFAVPSEPRGIVVFSHGSGSSRFSPRNQRVALALQRAGFATLLMDLLTASEETDDGRPGRLRFDVDFLSQRLIAASDWVARQTGPAGLPLGYFGASSCETLRAEADEGRLRHDARAVLRRARHG